MQRMESFAAWARSVGHLAHPRAGPGCGPHGGGGAGDEPAHVDGVVVGAQARVGQLVKVVIFQSSCQPRP